MTSLTPSFPKISIIIPVFNHPGFLQDAVLSSVHQTYPNFEVIVYDDCSAIQEVQSVLKRFQGDPRVKIFRGNTNEGVSMATNHAIIQSSGEYLAFLDCDDILPLHALETAMRYIKMNPRVHYFYSNRENIDEQGKIISRSDFAKYSHITPAEQLLSYMFASHLKIIKREAFYEVGLFKKEFDSCQDYEMALRMSECFSFSHIPECLYRYRIHEGQISQVKMKAQATLAYQARDVAVVRRQIFNGNIGSKKISIIMLTMNRWQRTRISLNQLYNNTTLPFELIILDNNSSEETVSFLQWFARQHNNVRLILEKDNLGCAGGRKKALASAGGDFIVMLDNDVRVTGRWLENLLVRLKEAGADAACGKVILPDGKVQYNGGRYRVSGGFILFSFIDNSLAYNDLKTFISRECDWLPGGATIYRRSVFNSVSLCEELRGGLEDNDLSLQMKRAGLKMVNCPASKMIHRHIRFEPAEMKDTAYSRIRQDQESWRKAMITFYRRNKLIIYDPWVYRQLAIPHGTRNETTQYFRTVCERF